MTPPLRVVQWATGNIGLKALRGIIEHPDLELVGVYVYGDKTGTDAGELCGLGPLGIIATHDVDESADLSRRPSPELLFDIMGFGREPNLFDGRRFAFGRESFGPSLALVADALGLPLDDLTSTGELAVAAHDVEIAAGPVAAGTVAAQRMVVTGLRAGEPFLQLRAHWYCSKDLDPAWDLLDTGWRVTVDGDAPLEIDLRFPVTLDRMAETTPGYTANRAVNAVPAVCAAAPGIRTTVDLPQVVARIGSSPR